MPCALRVLLAFVCGATLLAPPEASAFSSVRTTATYYHPSLHGLTMANGEPYNRWDPIIAASNWYPLGTVLKVTRQGSDDYIHVRVKDRGGRQLTLDLSEAGFSQLGALREGRIPIWIEVVYAADGDHGDLAERLRDQPRLARMDGMNELVTADLTTPPPDDIAQPTEEADAVGVPATAPSGTQSASPPHTGVVAVLQPESELFSAYATLRRGLRPVAR